MPGRIATILFLALAGVAATQAACSDKAKRNGSSTDITALRAMVRIPADTRTARWEVFGTPEYNGGVPGPSDYLTLVAELEAGDKPLDAGDKPLEAGSAETGGSVHIVPEAARPWLSSGFRTLLSESKNAALPLSSKNGCQPYQSVVTKSGQPVSGFICVRAGKSLLYLALMSTESA